MQTMIIQKVQSGEYDQYFIMPLSEEKKDLYSDTNMFTLFECEDAVAETLMVQQTATVKFQLELFSLFNKHNSVDKTN